MAGSFFIPSSTFRGITREFRTDNAGNTTVLVHEDLDPILTRNHEAMRDNPKGIIGKRSFSDDWRRVASFPLTLCLRIQQETGIDLRGMVGQDIDADQWNYIVKNYLNNSEYAGIRTSEGRV